LGKESGKTSAFQKKGGGEKRLVQTGVDGFHLISEEKEKGKLNEKKNLYTENGKWIRRGKKGPQLRGNRLLNIRGGGKETNSGRNLPGLWSYSIGRKKELDTLKGGRRRKSWEKTKKKTLLPISTRRWGGKKRHNLCFVVGEKKGRFLSLAQP